MPYMPFRDRKNGHLISLGLGLTGITCQGLSQLKGLNQLLALDLTNTNISDDGLVHLKTHHPHLKSLWIGLTSVTDQGVFFLRGLNELKTLSLQNTCVTRQGLEQLKYCYNLSSLNVENTDVTYSDLYQLQSVIPCFSKIINELIKDSVIDLVLENPRYSLFRISMKLRKKMLFVFPEEIESIWIKEGLETLQKRIEFRKKKLDEENLFFNQSSFKSEDSQELKQD